MNSIQLTEEHKSKVLEMCKVLFPEYKVKFIPDNLLEYDDQIFNYLSIEEITEKEVDFTVIHWFEFCMTYLCDKIFLPKGESRLDGIKGMDYYQRNENMHPIDYLYSEFKKLKT